ncbi:hypothetical protein HQ585_18395 [candidate division KSB1 bacterium]|nr:hypothetical protein [candidate division KSB1 bacterium]
MNKPVVIYGNGDLARLIRLMNQNEHIRTIAAYTAERAYIHEDRQLGCPLVSFETIEDRFPPEQYDMLVAIGYKRMRDRSLLFERAKRKGYTLINWISKRAIIYKPCTMGQNNIIDGGTLLGPGTRLGDNNALRPNIYMGHDVQIGSHNYIAPGVNLSGACKIGDFCFLGIGSTLIDRIQLADETLVGAGALMLQNSEPCSKYVGVPARKHGSHKESGICIGA